MNYIQGTQDHSARPVQNRWYLHYSLFTLRKPRPPVSISSERGFLRVIRQCSMGNIIEPPLACLSFKISLVMTIRLPQAPTPPFLCPGIEPDWLTTIKQGTGHPNTCTFLVWPFELSTYRTASC